MCVCHEVVCVCVCHEVVCVCDKVACETVVCVCDDMLCVCESAVCERVVRDKVGGADGGGQRADGGRRSRRAADGSARQKTRTAHKDVAKNPSYVIVSAFPDIKGAGAATDVSTRVPKAAKLLALEYSWIWHTTSIKKFLAFYREQRICRQHSRHHVRLTCASVLSLYT